MGRIPYYSHKYLTEILSTNIVYIFLIFHKNIAYIYISTKSSYTSMMMVIYTTQKKHIYDDQKKENILFAIYDSKINILKKMNSLGKKYIDILY